MLVAGGLCRCVLVRDGSSCGAGKAPRTPARASDRLVSSARSWRAAFQVPGWGWAGAFARCTADSPWDEARGSAKARGAWGVSSPQRRDFCRPRAGDTRCEPPRCVHADRRYGASVCLASLRGVFTQTVGKVPPSAWRASARSRKAALQATSWAVGCKAFSWATRPPQRQRPARRPGGSAWHTLAVPSPSKLAGAMDGPASA